MRPAAVPVKWVPSTSAFVVAAAASSARLVGVHRIGKPGVDDGLHGIGERGCVRRIACVRTAFDVAGAEQVAGAGERRDPFSVEQARVSADMIDVQVGADDEIDCVRREPGRYEFREEGRCWWSAFTPLSSKPETSVSSSTHAPATRRTAGIDEVGPEPGLRGNVFLRGFGEEVDREGHDLFDHPRDTHAVDVP